jgi:hypothetical protein
LGDRRNEELRAATVAVAQRVHMEQARELADSANAHIKMMGGAAAVAGAPSVGGAAGAGGSKAPVKRSAAGVEWEDQTMADWPENDFRLFVGNLGARSALLHRRSTLPPLSVFEPLSV